MKNEKQPSKTQWRFNYYLFLGAILFLFIAINAISFKRYYRVVLDRQGFAELSDTSKKLLNNLSDDLNVILFAAIETDPVATHAKTHLERLLDAYRYHSKKRINIKRVDPFIDQNESFRIAEKYNLAANEDVIIVEYGQQFRVIRLKDILEVRTDESGSQRLESFKGELELSSAIHALTSGRKRIIYFLSGHGEYNPFAEATAQLGYSTLERYISGQNIDVRTLNLAEKNQIPNDADLLIIAGPKSEYQKFEKDLIKAYLKKGGDHPGRLILMLDPRSNSGLEHFLDEYGVNFRNDLVLRENVLANQKQIEVAAVATEIEDHPVTKWLSNSGKENLAMGICRSIEVKLREDPDLSVTTELLKTSSVYWGEVHSDKEPVTYHQGVDTPGPINLAVIIDTGRVSDGEVQLNEMRVIAIGSASFLANAFINEDGFDFYMNCMNWMLGKDDMLGISPKQAEEFIVTLSESDLNTLRWLMGSVLFAGVVAGVLVWLRRRR